MKLADFEPYGIKPGTLSNYELGKTEPRMETLMFLARFFGVSLDNLLFSDLADYYAATPDPAQHSVSRREGSLPLVSPARLDAFLAGDEEGTVEAHYVIPLFPEADYLLRVEGSSMYPYLASGDVAACRRLPPDPFIEWNKCYVVSTPQGVLIKRLRRSCDPERLVLASDNADYEAFELGRREVRSLALIVGMLRLE